MVVQPLRILALAPTHTGPLHKGAFFIAYDGVVPPIKEILMDTGYIVLIVPFVIFILVMFFGKGNGPTDELKNVKKRG